MVVTDRGTVLSSGIEAEDAGVPRVSRARGLGAKRPTTPAPAWYFHAGPSGKRCRDSPEQDLRSSRQSGKARRHLQSLYRRREELVPGRAPRGNLRTLGKERVQDDGAEDRGSRSARRVIRGSTRKRRQHPA